MCLLIAKNSGAEIPYEYLVEADRSNPHGCGIGWSDGSRYIIEKDPKWGADQIAEKLDKLKDYPAIVHFRFMTHGPVVKENTHPFKVSRNWAAAHNGVFTNVKCIGDESDTRAFLRDKVHPYLKRGQCLRDPKVLKEIEGHAGGGNKLAFIHAAGKIVIANESAGHWKNGIWYSNYSYESLMSRYSDFAWEPRATHYPLLKNNSRLYNISELECQACGRQIFNDFYVNMKKEIICKACEEEIFFF